MARRLPVRLADRLVVTGPTDVVRLGTWARAVRLVVLAAVVVGITAGTWLRNDQGWPFAPMSQFAFAISPTDGEIHSRHLEAVTVDGERVVLDLSRGALGLQRAEIEGQLWSFAQDPSLLQSIAVLHARRLPDAPRLATVELVDDVRLVRDGVAGEPRRVTVVRWEVVDPERPESPG